METLTTWYVSTRHLRNPLQNRLAHIIGEHAGYGAYKTLCGGKVRICVDYRERVDPPTSDTRGYCKRCLKRNMVK